MVLGICPLFSGSTGNATLVAAAGTRLLVDAGVSASRLGEALQGLGLAPDELDGVLITHEHIDHIRGVGVMARKYGVPVFANAPTWQAMLRGGKLGEIPARCQVVFNSNQDFYIGRVNVASCITPHDAAQPVSFAFTAAGRKLVLMTDIGHMSRSLIDHMEGADILMLESNHDLAMLRQNSRYPAYLKSRIMSRHGHLSNETAAKTLGYLAGQGIRHLILAHLSAENNTPSLALETVAAAMEESGLTMGRDVVVRVAAPDRPGDMWAV